MNFSGEQGIRSIDHGRRTDFRHGTQNKDDSTPAAVPIVSTEYDPQRNFAINGGQNGPHYGAQIEKLHIALCMQLQSPRLHPSIQKFHDVLDLPMDGAGSFIPQQIYEPRTKSDRQRYVQEVFLEGPLYFVCEDPLQYGISLEDALHSRTKKLRDRGNLVFEGHGPSISIRIEWPGYRQWSRQIPAKEIRKSRLQSFTLAQLAKDVAKCVQRFILHNKNLPMEEEADPRWRVGDGPDDIKFEDLILVSIHHVALGSWQPQLRLVHPLHPNHTDVAEVQPIPGTPTSASPSTIFPS